MTDAEFATYPSLRGRAVIVTGAAAGIGASLAEHFVAQGARVACLDIADEAGAALCGRLGPEARFIHADVTDIASLRAGLDEAQAAFGPPSVLVNNAGHDERHRWQDVTPAYWDQRVAVNLRHQFFATQAVAPAMAAAGGGSVVNFGSTSWRIGLGGMPAYTSSKAAIEGLTRSFARDLGQDRIRVNCVLPGWIMTERQLALWVNAETEPMIFANQCLKEKLYPPDVARLVLWLAAEDSRMCTGQVWTVDGGWT